MKNICCTKSSNKSVDIKRLDSFLSLVGDSNRLRICCLLKNKELCVCEIEKVLSLPQNLVSHHLAKLKSLSLVEERREKTFMYYRLNKKRLASYLKLLKSLTV